MEYLDFSSVINIFRKYISDDRTIVNQCHLLKMQLHPTWHGQLLLPLT